MNSLDVGPTPRTPCSPDTSPHRDSPGNTQPLHICYQRAIVAACPRWAHESETKARSHTYLVQNEDFRKCRAKHGRGGDFIVLSDVHRVHLPFPIKLEW
ncbi:DUF6402 family protein [Acidovorax sp. GBBC 1281]|uniref:DUF6402 family protein n=1 Tax=Acidovorax sp. GBBC 1281 TaxID=2940492 RepID=UPI003FA460CF